MSRIEYLIVLLREKSNVYIFWQCQASVVRCQSR